MPSALTTIKLLGLVGVASYAAARLAVRLRLVAWQRAHVVAVPRHALPAMPRGFSVIELDAKALAQRPIDIGVAQQAARFAQGMRCLGAFTATDQLAGVIWVSAGPCTEGELPLRFHPPAGCGWDTGMWVHPDHRLGRAFAALWAGVGAWMNTRGLEWSASSIADYNLTSLAAHRRLGMAELGRFVALRVGRWYWIAAGPAPWRLALPGQIIDWPVPAPTAATASIGQAAPSLAA